MASAISLARSCFARISTEALHGLCAYRVQHFHQPLTYLYNSGQIHRGSLPSALSAAVSSRAVSMRCKRHCSAAYRKLKCAGLYSCTQAGYSHAVIKITAIDGTLIVSITSPFSGSGKSEVHPSKSRRSLALNYIYSFRPELFSLTSA